MAIMCRNHRGFIEATVAVAKLGANALYLNTAFAGPQLTEVVKREKPVAIVYDEEFADLLEDAGKRRKRFVAWHDSDDARRPDARGADRRRRPTEQPVPPEDDGRAIILTSGTTGTPKGANRGIADVARPGGLVPVEDPAAGRARPRHIAAPLFHSWGFAHFTLGLLLGSTLVLTRKFDPEESLAADRRSTRRDVAGGGAGDDAADPRAARGDARASYDTSSLKVVAASGSALPGDLATEWMDAFGDNALQPLRLDRGGVGDDRHARPTCAPRPAPPASRRAARCVKLYDERGVRGAHGRDRPHLRGQRDAVRGLHRRRLKDEIDGLMATGDVGRMDEAGRLFVEGRDDEMIVSGGENLFPKEVEDTARAPRRAWPRSPRSAWTTRSSASACARSWCRPGSKKPERGRAEEARQVEPGRLQGPARDLVPRRAAAQRHRQGAQAGAEGDREAAELARCRRRTWRRSGAAEAGNRGDVEGLLDVLAPTSSGTGAARAVGGEAMDFGDTTASASCSRPLRGLRRVRSDLGDRRSGDRLVAIGRTARVAGKRR